MYHGEVTTNNEKEAPKGVEIAKNIYNLVDEEKGDIGAFVYKKGAKNSLIKEKGEYALILKGKNKCKQLFKATLDVNFGETLIW